MRAARTPKQVILRLAQHALAALLVIQTISPTLVAMPVRAQEAATSEVDAVSVDGAPLANPAPEVATSAEAPASADVVEASAQDVAPVEPTASDVAPPEATPADSSVMDNPPTAGAEAVSDAGGLLPAPASESGAEPTSVAQESLTTAAPAGDGEQVAASAEPPSAAPSPVNRPDQAFQPAACGSLQAMVDAAPAGGTVSVPPCIYRQTVTINKPLTFGGQPGAEIRGSDVWSGWTRSGATWVSDSSVPALTAWPEPFRCRPGGDGRCLWPEQVFLDGRPLLQRAAGSVPAAGEFALASSTDRRIRLGENPTGRTVEVTVRPRWVVTRSDNVTIQGFTMRHAGNDALTGAVGNEGYSSWLLQDSVVSDAHGAVVSLTKGTNVRVLRNDISRGGDMGIHGTLVSAGLVQGNRMRDNNTEDFNREWGAGGLKVTEMRDFVMDGNEVDGNLGPGLWCDIACRNVTFSNNRVHHNRSAGILFEISDGGTVRDNAVWENGWEASGWAWGAGILVSNSANTRVYNNTLAWNADGISVVSLKRADTPAVGVVGNYVHNNTIIRSVAAGDYWANMTLAWLDDGTGALRNPASNNRGAANAYWDNAPSLSVVRFAWEVAYARLEDFSRTPGEEGGRALSDAEKDQALARSGMPSAPERS